MPLKRGPMGSKETWIDVVAIVLRNKQGNTMDTNKDIQWFAELYVLKRKTLGVLESINHVQSAGAHEMQCVKILHEIEGKNLTWVRNIVDIHMIWDWNKVIREKNADIIAKGII
jgi:hypothetical protein